MARSASAFSGTVVLVAVASLTTACGVALFESRGAPPGTGPAFDPVPRFLPAAAPGDVPAPAEGAPVDATPTDATPTATDEAPAGGAGVDEDLSASAAPRTHFIGVRAGVLIPATAKNEEYHESSTVGVYYAGELAAVLGLERLPLEIGLDFSRSDSDDGRVDADYYTLRVDLLFSKWSSFTARPDFYLLGGYGVVFASPEVDGKRGDVEYVSGFSVGAGLGSLEKRWDARVAYSALAGSANLRGLLAVTAGFRF